MNVYKLLGSPDEYYRPLSLKESLERAKGSLYESWFELLKNSPWYRAMWGGHPEFPDRGQTEANEFSSAVSVKNSFGDLRNIKFDDWWNQTGHQIFAEDVGYVPMQVLSIQYNHRKRKTKEIRDGKVPAHSMTVEIPLNLSVTTLRKQFDMLLKQQEQFQQRFNRWQHSTAEVHPYRDADMSFQDFKVLVECYKHWEHVVYKQRRKSYSYFDLYTDKLAELRSVNGVEERFSSELSPSELYEVQAGIAERTLADAINLMANATVMKFPNQSSCYLVDAYPLEKIKKYLGY